MSQDGGYGDDYQPSFNYPTCRTHNHSFIGVASKKKNKTYFDVPNDIELGDSVLEVVAMEFLLNEFTLE